MKYWLKVCLVVASISCGADNDFDFSGFGSLGYISSDSDVYGYRNDLSQPNGIFENDFDFKNTTVLGVQMGYVASNQFDVVIQGVYRGQDDFDLDKAIAQAFLRYDPSVNWTARFGRVPISLFHYTEYRDIGFALTWAKVPNEVYGLVPYRFLDGADLTFQRQFGSSTFRSKIFYGTSKTDIGANGDVEEVGVEQAYGLTLELEHANWLIETSHSLITLENNIPSIEQLLQGIAFIGATAPAAWPDSAAFASDLSLASKQGRYSSISASYNLNNWKFETEFARVRGDGILIRPLDSAFASLTYKFDDWSLYTIVADTDTEHYRFIRPFTPSDVYSDPQTIAIVEQIFAGIDITSNFFSSNQQTWSLGARWNIGENVALKLQYDRTHIDEDGGTLWVSEPINFSAEDKVNTLHANVSFIF
ncbi:MAG: hypothetical protein HWE27_13860 [Gammaproteobacteria bacterium]|nr:hypothetical protein [Gammaproteobacteria bacterium]